VRQVVTVDAVLELSHGNVEACRVAFEWHRKLLDKQKQSLPEKVRAVFLSVL